MKFFTYTFGCRVNQYETESLREQLSLSGWQAVDAAESADLYLINTCTVTQEADRDCLKLLRKIQKKNPSARIVVTGCYATRAPQEIHAVAPQAVIVNNQDKNNIPALLGCQVVSSDYGIREFHAHSRAFLKIQDGCNMHCTYCIIPSVRGSLTSKPYAQVEEEFRSLLRSGYQEIVLCGVRLGRYLVWDKEGKRVDFVELLNHLIQLPGRFRIRLSSFEITDVTDRFLQLFVNSAGKICPSFHLPLQSGADKVLERMQRWYTTRFYQQRIEALRRAHPDVGLFTDLMVGFPQETREEFERSTQFVLEMGFSGLHVFRYSSREGTPAASFPAVAEEEIWQRAERMRSLDRELRKQFGLSAVGQRREVLVEKNGSETEGVTDHFLRVSLKGPPPSTGLHWAHILRVEENPPFQVVAECLS
ncbi:MAG: tRNA (N(6)-L-threonylcarbamoyladenosine(37)-C(2))-methylthiotransferase MtaB [Elusimicrobia bacterium]|nr:tRNA (N(6)-L-threonylcarbamoyladenosine(37)-C(2))-methylthiotransferase MtaB [Elusimicrobiota bacterium]